MREYVQSCRPLVNSCQGRDGSISSTRAAGSYPLPLWERVAAKRRGEGGAESTTVPDKAPLTPTLSHARSHLWHESRCARGEGAHRVRGTAVPNRNQAYSIRPECALISHSRWSDRHYANLTNASMASHSQRPRNPALSGGTLSTSRKRALVAVLARVPLA